jgi:hypothetical protein
LRRCPAAVAIHDDGDVQSVIAVKSTLHCKAPRQKETVVSWAVS